MSQQGRSTCLVMGNSQIQSLELKYLVYFTLIQLFPLQLSFSDFFQFPKVQSLFCTCFTLHFFSTCSTLALHLIPNTIQNVPGRSSKLHHGFWEMPLHQRSWGRDIYHKGVFLRTYLVNHRKIFPGSCSSKVNVKSHACSALVCSKMATPTT